MKRVIVFLSVFVIAVSCLYSGPFGLEFGWTRLNMQKAGVELLKQKDLGGGSVAYLVDPLKKLSLFSTYEVKINSEYGLYYIGASGNLDEYYEVKDAFNSLERLLTISYGSPKTVDDSGVSYLIASNSEDSLVWIPSSKNGNDTSVIILSRIRQGVGLYSTYIQLEYFSKNYDQVEAQFSSVL